MAASHHKPASQGSLTIEPRRVVVAGGGVAALESLLALHDLGEGRFELTLLSPDEEFVVRAMSVAVPFGAGHMTHVSLANTCAHLGVRRIVARLASVDATERIAWTDDGDRVDFDELIVATGAAAVPAVAHALTFSAADPTRLNGLLADIDQGYCHSLAVVVPAGGTWALPAYELALLIAEHAYSANESLEVHLITPEPDALAIFGPEAGAAVRQLLERAHVHLHLDAYATVERNGHILIAPGDRVVDVERVVALPAIRGRAVPGLESDVGGFLRTDQHARVRDVDHVYAVGDCADFPVKQGGLATQQADAAVRHIAAEAGAPVEATPFRPVLRGKLLTAGAPRFLRNHSAGGGEPSKASTTALWWPPVKIVGHYLAPWLAQHEGIAPHAVAPDVPAIAVERALPDERSSTPMALSTLGVMPLSARW